MPVGSLISPLTAVAVASSCFAMPSSMVPVVTAASPCRPRPVISMSRSPKACPTSAPSRPDAAPWPGRCRSAGGSGLPNQQQHGLLGALIRPIFAADSIERARDRLSEAVAHLDGRLGKIATMLEDAETDILAFYAFPVSHWRKLRFTNPLERFNKEVGRRTDVVGIFPDDRSLIRLARPS